MKPQSLKGLTRRERRSKRIRKFTPKTAQEGPVDFLYARKIITQDQRDAADRLRRDHELATIGSISSPDLGRTPIGKNGYYMGLSDGRLDAIQRVNRTAVTLSKVTFHLLDLVCIQGFWLKEAAEKVGYPIDYIGVRFREALDDLRAYHEDMDSRNLT